MATGYTETSLQIHYKFTEKLWRLSANLSVMHYTWYWLVISLMLDEKETHAVFACNSINMFYTSSFLFFCKTDLCISNICKYCSLDFQISPDKHTKCRFQTLIICKCLKSVWSINTYWPFEFDLDRLHYFLLLDYHWLHQYIEHILRLYIYAVPYNSNSVFSCFLPLAVTHYYQTEPCSCISNK